MTTTTARNEARSKSFPTILPIATRCTTPQSTGSPSLPSFSMTIHTGINYCCRMTSVNRARLCLARISLLFYKNCRSNFDCWIFMDANLNPVDSRKSFFNRAAWCSFCIPLVTAAVTFVLTCAIIFKYMDGDFFFSYLYWAFRFQIIGVILGLLSLFGIPRHGAELILWKAAAGIATSCGVGYVVGYVIPVLAFAFLWHGC